MRADAGEAGDDAIKLLKQDHREVERLFEQFEDTQSEERQQSIAARICTALRTHTSIEEEIFYPAFLEASEETEIHHEAEVEHEGAKRLIDEIESAGPQDDYFHARVSVLKEMIKHHVQEEERRGGMFTKAKQANMDLQALGEQLKQRKMELMAEAGDELDGGAGGMGRDSMQGERRGRRAGREARARS
jgi:hemerythrin superfamily protein